MRVERSYILSGDAIVTGGTSTIYTVSSYEVFASLLVLNGQMIAFTPHVTNSGAAMLNVDSLGAKPLRTSPNVELQSGILIQGTPYVAVYNNSDQAFYLRGVGPTPGIPLGASIDYWGTSAPSTYFALAYGQAISRTTYATLFSLFGTTFGTGDGSTTFNIPDLRGRVVAGKDDMGGSAASRLSGTSITVGGATTLGGSGGAEAKTLLIANLPPYTPAGTLKVAIPVYNNVGTSGITVSNALALANSSNTSAGVITIPDIGGSTPFTGTAQGGTSNPVTVVMPTIIGNKLLRII